MANLTPAQIQEKHARRLKASLSDMKQGIEKVTVSPTAQAAEKGEKMKARLVEAIDSGKWKRGLLAVSLQSWKDSIITKGLPRIASGIDGAKEKVEKFYGQLIPHIEKGKAEIKTMPDLSLEDSISRMGAFTRHMAKFQFKK